jgi:hypothetical protein
MARLPGPDLPPGEVLLSIRRSRSSTEVRALREVTLAALDGAQPWRVPVYRKGQINRPGKYWSVIEHAHVSYESLTELKVLLSLDREPRIRRILAQPFQLSVNEPKGRRFVPDFLTLLEDQTVEVIEVKPRDRVLQPEVEARLDWGRRELENHGWSFRLATDPDLQCAYNLRFLAGYRRRWLFDASLLATIRLETYEPEFFGRLEARMADLTRASRPIVRAHMLHLVWTGDLSCNLNDPLNRGTVLLPAGRVKRNQP